MKKLLIIFFISCVYISYSQEVQQQRIKLDNAEYIATDEKLAPGIQMLVGSVRMLQDEAILLCDSAAFNRANNSFEAYGNVKILQGDTLSLTCLSMLYLGNEKLAKAQGKVVLKNKDMTVYSDTLDFDRQEQRAYYYTRSKITDPEKVIESDIGVYFLDDSFADFFSDVTVTGENFLMQTDTLRYLTKKKHAIFNGPTTITSKEEKILSEQGSYYTIEEKADLTKNNTIIKGRRTLFGDTLKYDKKKKYADFKGNVVVRDFDQKTALFADYGQAYQLYDSLIFQKNPRIAYIMDKDTLFLRADTLIATRKVKSRELSDSINKNSRADTIKYLRAFYDVRYFKNDMQGRSDSLYSNDSTGKMIMYGSPVMWANESQISADTLCLKRDMKREVMDSLYLIKNAFVASMEPDSISYNQISGIYIKGKFIEDDLRRLNVIGNAETIYFSDNEKKERVGINKSESSYMNIILFDKKVMSISFLEKPVATMYPENQLKEEEKFLKGYKNRKSERPPSRESVWGEKIPDLGLDKQQEIQLGIEDNIEENSIKEVKK